jgi:hypothetical protein
MKLDYGTSVPEQPLSVLQGEIEVGSLTQPPVKVFQFS